MSPVTQQYFLHKGMRIFQQAQLAKYANTYGSILTK